MLSIIYKTTIKNILRSPTFFMILIILVLVTIQGASYGFYVGDDAPDMVIQIWDYVECVENACSAKLMMYIIPIFVSFLTVLILKRDYGDSFFEIEKASGISAFKYILGRLLALITVSFTIMFAMNLLLIHRYVFSRGGVQNMGIVEYIIDSLIRVFFIDVSIALPGIIFYITLTYFIGTLLNSEIAAAVVSVTYALGNYVSFLIFWSDLPTVIFDYFSPTPSKLRRFFRFFGTEWFEASIQNNGTTVTDAVFCILFLTFVSIAFSVIAYLRIRKRTV